MNGQKYTIRRTQVYGMRCSGTNYLDALIQRNFPSLELGSPYDNANPTFGWKHADVNTPGYSERDGYEFHKSVTPLDWSRSRDTLLLIIYRNPFNWLQSLHRQPWHVPELYGVSFSEFLRHDWAAYYSRPGEDQSPDPAVRRSIMKEENLLEAYDSVLAMRQAKTRIFESFKDRFYNAAFINYEALSRNPEAVMNDIADAYNLNRAPVFEAVETYKGGSEPYRGSAYTPTGANDLHFILNRTDWAQEHELGYAPKAGARLLASTTRAQMRPEKLLRIVPCQRFYVNGKLLETRERESSVTAQGAFSLPAFIEHQVRGWRAAGP